MLKAPAYAEVPAGRPAYGTTPPSAGRQSSNQNGKTWLAGNGNYRAHNKNDIYPVRNNASLFCSPACGGNTFQNNSGRI
jgi:hypothetical protein